LFAPLGIIAANTGTILWREQVVFEDIIFALH